VYEIHCQNSIAVIVSLVGVQNERL